MSRTRSVTTEVRGPSCPHLVVADGAKATAPCASPGRSRRTPARRRHDTLGTIAGKPIPRLPAVRPRGTAARGGSTTPTSRRRERPPRGWLQRAPDPASGTGSAAGCASSRAPCGFPAPAAAPDAVCSPRSARRTTARCARPASRPRAHPGMTSVVPAPSRQVRRDRVRSTASPTPVTRWGTIVMAAAVAFGVHLVAVSVPTDCAQRRRSSVGSGRAACAGTRRPC